MVINKKVHYKFRPNGWTSFFLLLIPFLGILWKNLYFLSFIFGDNCFEPNFYNALSMTTTSFILQLCVIIFLYSFCLLFKGNGKFVWAIFANTFFTVLYLLDTAYYRFFNELPSFLMLTLFNGVNTDSNPSAGNTMLPLRIIDIFFGIDLIISILAMVFASGLQHSKFRKAKKQGAPWSNASLPGKKTRFTKFFVIEFLAVSCLAVFPQISIYNNVNELGYAPSSNNTSISKAVSFTPLGYHLMDIVDSIGADIILSKNDQYLIDSYYRWVQDDYTEDNTFGSLQGKNVITIQLESFEDFVIGLSVDGQEITPNLNKFMQSSYHFTNIVDSVKSGTSSDCDLQLLTSILPGQRISSSNFYSSNTFNSIPTILSQQGYTSAYFNASKYSFWDYEPFTTNALAFDILNFDYDKSDKIGTYISDKSFLEQSLDIMQDIELQDGDTNYYYHMVLNTSHGPFKLPQQYRYLDLSSNLDNSVLGDYYQCMSYTDRQLGVFMDTLDSKGILDNTVVLFMGDHGGLHKYFPDEINKLGSLYDDAIGKNYDYRVACLLYDKSLEKTINIDTYGCHIDIMPSLLYLLGTDYSLYKDTAMGKCLFTTQHNFALSANGHFFGDCTTTEKEYLKNSYYVAYRMLRINYFVVH